MLKNKKILSSHKPERFKLKSLFFSLLFLIILSILFFNFTVKSINLDNFTNTCLTKEEFNSSFPLDGKNIFTINPDAFKKAVIEKYPCVKSIEIKKIYPSKLEIILKNRTPLAQLKKLNKNQEVQTTTFSEKTSSSESGWFFDEDGIVFMANLESSGYTIVYLMEVETEITSHDFKNAAKIITGLQFSGFPVIEGKIYPTNLDAKDTISSGLRGVFLIEAQPKIIFSLTKEPTVQLASLQLITRKAKIDEEKLEEVDLRFDNPVVRYAPKNKI